jgi:hypothetical protein
MSRSSGRGLGGDPIQAAGRTGFFLGFRFLTWFLGTFWEGTVAVVRALRCLPGLSRAVRETLSCPRGHEVPVYGVYECTCGALHEGWAFDRCAVCGQAGGWTPCPECSLPVRNPVRR